MEKKIGNIRIDYMLKKLSEKDVLEMPMRQFEVWWNEAVESKITEVNAMTLSTVATDGQPSARIVLLKEFSDQGFTFFTNYESKKGRQIAENSKVSLVFFWKELQRQVCIEGIAEKIDEAASDAYFQSRPYGSRIGAWSSPQSRIIASRDVLEENEANYKKIYPEAVPKPPHWGGYLIKPETIEFWQGRSSRLHDRIVYTLVDNQWKIFRVAP
ncbi:pyridoxamine 5'-phosphate oxidase [Haoranjiania flava]|uniref:Pyridoxine/pyridoxamine 5'-phosphate oxidase n=1 Tax=Haoranjiania flava TaxID=1856322 RepID=A0AAE3IQ45_9BACT|nr:pyridoxamine 5'-phosphate oxidase [Haoranjiania flava]MCU7693752.1 pyridoxamine 5'-phosphate oxidase [Haoranjiania flava]